MTDDDIVGRRAREALGLNTQLCTATNSRGEPCGSPAIRGGFVCRHHGGGTPQAQLKAQQRLWSLVDIALAHVHRVLITKPDCEHCGRSDNDLDPTKIRAAIAVLDRNGYGPSATLKVEATQRGYAEWPMWLSDEERAQFVEMMTRAKQRMAAGEPAPGAPPPSKALDTYVVNEETDTATFEP